MERARLEKLELDARKLQQELDQRNREKLSLHQDLAVVQQQLQGVGVGVGGSFLLSFPSPSPPIIFY